MKTPGRLARAPENFLDAQQIAAVLPNRNGMVRTHGLWEVNGKPDVKNAACMKNCPTTGVLSSQLPEEAKDSHGDLAAQQRVVGPAHGSMAAGGLPALPLSWWACPISCAARAAWVAMRYVGLDHDAAESRPCGAERTFAHRVGSGGRRIIEAARRPAVYF